MLPSSSELGVFCFFRRLAGNSLSSSDVLFFPLLLLSAIALLGAALRGLASDFAVGLATGCAFGFTGVASSGAGLALSATSLVCEARQ
jgi:hypothetical protein